MEREALKKTFRPRLGSPASGVVVTGGASGIGLASGAQRPFLASRSVNEAP